MCLWSKWLSSWESSRISGQRQMIIPLLLNATLALQATPTIESVWQPKLKDVSFAAKFESYKRSELRKISDDFARSYNFERVKIFVKEPFKVRVEMYADDTEVTYIINGGIQKWRIPKLRQYPKVDVSKSPGRRQTFLDFGFLTPSLFEKFFQSKFVRVDRETKEYVFDLTYVEELNDDVRHRVWMDPEKKVQTKREWYDQKGRLKATFFYEKHKLVNGVWVPSAMSVRNAEDKFAARTIYGEPKVNAGINDSIFAVE